MLKVVCVCGARPNFIKIAPIIAAFKDSGKISSYLVHTGQHYDERMSDLFFKDLGIPEPDINLLVGSGSHAQQTAEIMVRFEKVVLEQEPDWVVVVGDVNSTIACALVASKLGVKVAHVEAGLRSFDRRMPEEINRVLTDSISDMLFVTEQSGMDNLRREGVTDEKIHFVGNVMIDTLLKNRDKAEQSRVLEELGVEDGSYAAVTLHRPSNVDDKDTVSGLLEALEEIASELPLVLPLHPRTRANLEKYGLIDRVKAHAGMITPAPLGYLDFIKLTAHAAVVITDSGGVQEETTILGVPCLTVRENTERPSTITDGTNRLVDPSRDALLAAYEEVKANKGGPFRTPALWDSQAASRIAAVFLSLPAAS